MEKTIKERARELWGNLPVIQEDYIPMLENALKEQKEITKKETIHKAYLWLLENCFAAIESPDTDVHFESGYIHYFLKDMEDNNWKSKLLDKEE